MNYENSPKQIIALHLALIKKSELNLNDKDVFPQVCIGVFLQATYFYTAWKKACTRVVWSYSLGHVDHSLTQWRSQEFCSGGASHWRRQISNFSYFARRSWCHWSISGLLQQDMTSNIFYQWASINFNEDKKTFAFAVIIIKQLLTKQFSMNIKSSRKRRAV